MALKLTHSLNTKIAIARVFVMGWLAVCCGPAMAGAPAQSKDPDAILRELGASVIRGVDMDICFPANSDEYEALGKNAVLMLTAWTAVGTELPLKSAYLEIKGVRVPLHRVTMTDKKEAKRGSETYTQQTSFYLLPISLLKGRGDLSVDFSGERASFEVSSFTANSLLRGAPTFVRLDEYDKPSEADDAALRALLVREYADFFAKGG